MQISVLFVLLISSVSAQVQELKKLGKFKKLPFVKYETKAEEASNTFFDWAPDERAVEELILHSDATVQCIQDSIFYLKNLAINHSNWALQMFESNGIIPAGIIGVGNLHAEGFFDECLRVQVANRFSGQYCTVFLKPLELGNDGHGSNETTLSDNSMFVLPSFSVCVPSTCQVGDIRELVTSLLANRTFGNQTLVPGVDQNYCFKQNETIPIDNADITVTAVLAVLLLFVLIGTTFEAWREQLGRDTHCPNDKWIVKFFLCYSALTNGRKLLSFRANVNPDNFSCIHGIRFFSTCWVVLGHVWLKIAITNTINPTDLLQDAKTTSLQTIVNATVSVDTFFLISGLLVTYFLLKELDKRKGRFNPVIFYLHRYLRLTPVYGILLGVIATLVVHVGTGPNWNNVIMAAQDCRRTWWKQLLYINNLFSVSSEGQCMGETWYLAVDMQLFILSPIFIYIIWRWKKAGFALLAAATLSSLGTNFFVFGFYSLPPTLLPTRINEMTAKVVDYMDLYYFKTWTRAPPYFVGIATGWILYQSKGSKVAIHKALVAFLWMLSAAVGLAIVYGLAPYLDESKYEHVDSIVQLTYGPLHRIAWALAVAWVIFACVHGHGEFVNRLLSWNGFLPLSRLTYCVYLIHYDYLNIFFAMSRRLSYYTVLNGITTFFGITVTVFLMAFVVALTVEAPFFNVEKLLFSHLHDKTKPELKVTLFAVTDENNRSLEEGAENNEGDP